MRSLWFLIPTMFFLYQINCDSDGDVDTLACMLSPALPIVLLTGMVKMKRMRTCIYFNVIHSSATKFDMFGLIKGKHWVFL